jgi:pyruvate dehydrogenase E1 component alpha subunit
MSHEELIRLYRQMYLIRRFEDRAAFAYAQAKFTGYLHLAIGQEAVCVGFISALRPDDHIIDSYRDHGHYLARGGDPKRAMAELYGRATGCSKGKGGSMHLFDRERNFYGGTGIVGAGIPIGLGIAFALKYRGGDQVCLCFFGDGAINTGAFHESMNMASLWDMPILFICENNQYAMGTSVERHSSIAAPLEGDGGHSLLERAAGYGMPRERVDGQDVFAVRELAERAIAAAREDRRPWFIEVLTYRYRGHGAADPGNYRTREEIARWQERDPIGILEAKLLKDGVLKPEDAECIQQEVRDEVDEAIRFAEQSERPAADELYTDIFAA